MARETVWQRRARKIRATEGEYYPKVDLSKTASDVDVVSLLPDAPGLALAPALVAIRPRSQAEDVAPPREEPTPTPKLSLVAAEPGNETDGPLHLPESLDLSAATPLAKALIERRGAPIVIDGSQVGQVGAQCVQVLLSAKRTWDADGASLLFVNCAPRMIEDLWLLGIDTVALMDGGLPQ
jgi:chemotaxis protein CheX